MAKYQKRRVQLERDARGRYLKTSRKRRRRSRRKRNGHKRGRRRRRRRRRRKRENRRFTRSSKMIQFLKCPK